MTVSCAGSHLDTLTAGPPHVPTLARDWQAPLPPQRGRGWGGGSAINPGGHIIKPRPSRSASSQPAQAGFAARWPLERGFNRPLRARRDAREAKPDVADRVVGLVEATLRRTREPRIVAPRTATQASILSRITGDG
jgi:hypothetical protein